MTRARVLRLIAGLLVAGGGVAPALAAPVPAVAPAAVAVTIEDAEGILPADQAALLERRLAGLRTRGVAVVYVRRAPGGVERLAEATFGRLALPDDAVAVAVAVEDREVAAHVGPTIRARRVDRDAIKDLIGMYFKASARKGRYDLAAGALAEAIVDARPSPPTPAPAPTPEPSFWATDAGWAVMAGAGLALVAAVGVGLAIAGTGTPGGVPPARKPKPATGRPREVELAELAGARDRVRADALALGAAPAHPPLAGTIAALLDEARAFEAACAAPGAVDLGVLTMTALNLEVAIAALRTALANGAEPRANEALVAGRRWKHAEVQAEYLIREGHAAAGNADFLLAALAEGWAALRDVPQDLARADRKLDMVEMRLRGLGLTRLASASPGAVAAGGWLSAAAASASAAREREALAGAWDLHAVVVEAYEPPPAAPAYVAPAGTSSGSSSWSSSDSGSSSWSSSDSGSSSWSSSDSGSSSWGSDSTGSDKW